MKGDILAIRGRGLISEGILKATGNTVSHVGMFLDNDPDPIITEALYRVITHKLSVALENCDAAFLIHDKNLSDLARENLTAKAESFSAESYNYFDIGLQLLDALTQSRVFTTHLMWGRWPICSYLVSAAYEEALALDFGVSPKSCTPNDIYSFALNHPIVFDVQKIK